MKQMRANYKGNLEVAADVKKSEKRRQVEEEMSRKIKGMQDYIHKMEQQMAAHKQEEKPLLREMEVTGTAFEDMQEQNSQLLEQLREKDDASFKLMTERIKMSQSSKLANTEKETLNEMVKSLSMEINLQGDVIVGLEKKERSLDIAMTDLERTVMGQKTMIEKYKTTTMGTLQELENLKLELKHAQMSFDLTKKESIKVAARAVEFEFVAKGLRRRIK